MNVLIVHAHHEPRSFCSALFRQAVQTLTELGHDVVISDLYKDGFDPVSDRRNFTSVHNPDYLKQQEEERYATEVQGFSEKLEREIRKLEACDLLIFSFPLWWFGMPAILKGWVDRVFAMVRIYGGGKTYENGLGGAQKKAMTLFTTGGGPDNYSGFGVNPPLARILAPIEHGVFWFNGFLPLDPFIAWGPARIGQQEREGYLIQLDRRFRRLRDEEPRRLPPIVDFPGGGKDTKKRFMVSLIHRPSMTPALLETLGSHEAHRVAELKRSGVILSSYFSQPGTEPWRGFLLFRETDAEAVQTHIESLPLAPYLEAEFVELRQT